MEEIWVSFMDLVHGIGAVGCALLALGFVVDAEPARAAFYVAVTLLFALALRERRRQRPAPRPLARVVDLRDSAPAPVRSS